ncbi:MAG: cation:proton antiporter [Caldilineaceae bacterium]
MSTFESSVLFFLQLAFILTVCRGIGWLARRVGQPQVVAEMIAGMVMGPSLFGWLFPNVQTFFFPEASKGLIYAVSQLGLVLYMFLVGLEFNTSILRNRLRSAAGVSLSGMLVPFILGASLGFFLMRSGGFFGDGVVTWEAMFFVGTSMSITAFPMLARIIYERGLSNSSLGTLALAAGSIDDGASWCVLALVLASFSGDPMIAVLAIGGGTLYTIGTLTIGRRLLQRLGDIAEREKRVSPTLLTITLILVMLGAWFTDRIGIYAVFGAFIMGAAMPRGRFVHEIQRQIEPLITSFLLPLYFIYSGLNTRIALVDSPWLWWITFVILLAACLGKGVACWAAARMSGEDNRSALAIGTLMNARGLMELIILNIGLQRGIITPLLFTVMVIMAIVTTLITSPIFEWVYRRPTATAVQRVGESIEAIA